WPCDVFASLSPFVAFSGPERRCKPSCGARRGPPTLPRVNIPRHALLSSSLLGLVACASSVDSKPVVEFPSAAALAAIEARPAAPVPVKSAELPAARWAVEPQGTARAAFEPWTPATESERTL